MDAMGVIVRFDCGGKEVVVGEAKLLALFLGNSGVGRY